LKSIVTKCNLWQRPYTKPYPEIAVASSVHAVRRRHQHTNTGGYDSLSINWDVANKMAAEQGRTMDPGCLRLVGPMHLAESRAEARKDVEYGFEKTKRSYELFARHVKPHFQGANAAREESMQWARENAGEFMGAARKTIARYQQESNS
jgi:hypothetical protein